MVNRAIQCATHKVVLLAVDHSLAVNDFDALLILAPFRVDLFGNATHQDRPNGRKVEVNTSNLALV